MRKNLALIARSLSERLTTTAKNTEAQTMTANETDLRKAIAEQVRYELMPLCVCASCGNELEGRIVQQAIEIILRCPVSA
jgi:hypothetical protein